MTTDDDLRRALDDLVAPLTGPTALPARTARRARTRRRVKVAGAAVGSGAAVAALALALAGLPSDVATVGPAAPPAAPSPEPSPVPAEEPTPEPDPVLGLRMDGLATAAGPAGELVPFGTPQDEALDRLGGDVGVVLLPDCGPTAASAVLGGGVVALFQDGALVGWSTAEPAATTPEGLGVGSTLDEVRAAQPGTLVETTTLGVEWYPGGEEGFAGSLDGDEPTSRVTAVRAGETCLVR